ncbi:multidrug resistance-associated ABC transporter [Guyanagaster necrorhizus]|uniref:Multidrug resistance-associated ABC transporter n=1 Tax=Guyanagaster necrorhizus TaxID=856835 RepID=A0A9P8AQ64_9AGAR|nr:multidrug resistance-associated ABC transporter [Guyanagaster necrorhizus MCA 3950]KAG7443764.1 multidrug resistance-associated ABC transporter [Guyanagaster necrorhizus MCA 3950]
MGLCRDSGPLALQDACIRGSWSVLIPTTLVITFCIFSIPIKVPAKIQTFINDIQAPLQTFLPLHEAEALDLDDKGPGGEIEVDYVVPLWRTVVFALLGLVEALSWLGDGSYRLAMNPQDPWSGIQPLLMALTWLYTVVVPVARPSPTPPFDLFTLYLVHFLSGIILLGGSLYETSVYDLPLPPATLISAYSINLVIVLLVLGVVVSMPLDLPSRQVDKKSIGTTVSPEDYTTLFGWLTFSWVYPLVNNGRYNTLNDADVWNLSPSFQSRPLFIKFSSVTRSSLLRKIWASNSLDIILDAFFTILSVIFNYTTPFFLNRILASIDSDAAPEDRTNAYIYAFLMFIISVARAELDLQHLWFGRRAATRIRSELMAAIYDKALKRKDFSGIIDADKGISANDKKDAATANGTGKKKAKAKEDDKGDDPKAGADVGKIVNLMAGDANKISNMVTGAYYIYGAPLEIIIGGIFLYQLLGWSAFAGFVVLLAGWPLNSYLSKRSVRIQKGYMAEKDKRMGVLSELIGAVKFIKFFAWEDRWIDRAMEARGKELKWLIKSRVNWIMFHVLWTTAPILVSIIAFFAYIVQGNELTISTAFTAISLFAMIRGPLNIIPMWIVQVLQTGVALKRIEVYLQEEEVTDQVSSLKKDLSEPLLLGPDEDGLGLENASLKWNEVEKPKEDEPGNHNKLSAASSTESAESLAETIEGEPVDHKFELRDISVLFPEGELSIITGPTASGKTALLIAVLGEMTLLDGRIIMAKDRSRIDEHGNMHAISYAAQAPWLRHQSIKDNILFGYQLDEERYEAVIECCALKPDLAMLEDGDATEIGARGVSLSGGQKARVALARAVYARTRYVLLDDPLSAVDSHTARFLYERLLLGPLLANRTVVLVTHHVELVLPGAYYLVRMLDGRIDAKGTVKDLRAQGLLDEITHDAALEAHEEQIQTEHSTEVTVEAITDKSTGVEAKRPRKLIKDEHRETGGVKWSIYRSYLKASSYWIWGLLLFFVAVNQLLGISEKLWIKTWGEAYGDVQTSIFYNSRAFSAPEHEIIFDGHIQSHIHNFHNAPPSISFTGPHLPDAREHPLFYVGVYAAIGVGAALVSVMSTTAQFTGALRASRILFQQLLVTVVRATFRFHDTTPQGRMLNRFGKDIEVIDSSLAGSMQAVNSSLASFFASILTVAVIFPVFLIPATLIGFIYRELAIGYLNTGRDLRRMQSNTRSPIFSDFGELLEGIVTVRAFSAEKRFLDNLHKKIDTTTKMWYGFWMTNRWLLLNFDALGATAVFVTALFSISSLNNGAGLAGLCITSALSFTSSVYWACRFWTGLELDLNSVERVVEYLELPQEPPAVIESHRPPAYWPSSSENDSLIAVENLVVKYSPELPAVLQDISFTLKAGERIGLLGRTGSGKSTLAMSILRFVDPTEGRILIDGIDTSTIGIHDLRSRLTFIPQDATLFSGTLRDNLDPFGDHNDAECMEALYRVQMISQSQFASRRTSRAPSELSTPAASRPASVHDDTTDSVSATSTDVDAKTTVSLDTKVSPGGTNFSQGQRQLIAMARALLRRSSIIVLDEATSSIDFATDAKIQTTIREEFTQSLLLTVAHRLRTVIDYDRLIILDKGKIAEFDTPLRLIEMEDGIFRNMCLKSGSFGELQASAKAKAERDEATGRGM